MAERMLISKIIKTQDGRAELYAKGHRYKDLVLFDLGDLYSVGIDPTKLEVGVELPVRFYALWQESEKLNKVGNPYKDIVSLEPTDKPATTTSTDNSELLAEVRGIKALLQALLESQGVEAEEPEPSELDDAFPRYGDGSAPSDNPHEQQEFKNYVDSEGNVPRDVDQLRAWVRARQNAKAGK